MLFLAMLWVYILALALPTSWAISTPLTSSAKTSFLVPCYARSKSERNGPAAKSQAYAKYGWSLAEAEIYYELGVKVKSKTSSLSAVATPATSSGTGPTPTNGGSTVAATPAQQRSQWIANIYVGNQGPFRMDFDTGSADLWLFGSSLPQNDLKQHNPFNPSQSSTFKSLPGYSWKIKYGDGSSAKGTVGTDSVTIGGKTLSSQAIEVATTVSSSFVHDAALDGLMGLAFSSINTVKPQKQKTYFDNVLPTLVEPLFAVDLNDDDSGSYQFGGTDSTKYSGSLVQVPCSNSSGFWAFSNPTYTIAGKTYQTGGTPAIADTGTSLLYVEPNTAKTYWAQVPGATYSNKYDAYVFPCKQSLPPIELSMAGSMVEIAGSLLNYVTVDQAGQTCYGGLQSNSGERIQIFGDLLFRSAYVVFKNGDGFLGLEVAPKA